MPRRSSVLLLLLVALGVSLARAQGPAAVPAGAAGLAAHLRPEALPPSALAGRTLLLSETIVGEHAAPLDVVLAGGGVYRLEILPTPGPYLHPSAEFVTNSHWQVENEAQPCFGVSVRPRETGGRPLQILSAPDAGVQAVGGLELILRPRQAGAYRVDATVCGATTLLLRVVRQDADDVDRACVRERDAGGPGRACAERHAARRSLSRFGPLFAPVSVLLVLAAGALLGT